MTMALTESHIKEALSILELTGETGRNAKYEPYFGPLVMDATRYRPFVVRIDDTGYQCHEKGEISLHHDGGKVEWRGGWEACSPYVSRNPYRFLPRRTGKEYRYHRRKFVIPGATYVITERFDVIDRVFVCTNAPDFEWNYVLGCFESYRKLNRVLVPSKGSKRIQHG